MRNLTYPTLVLRVFSEMHSGCAKVYLGLGARHNRATVPLRRTDNQIQSSAANLHDSPWPTLWTEDTLYPVDALGIISRNTSLLGPVPSETQKYNEN
jgi:hypothetical protein